MSDMDKSGLQETVSLKLPCDPKYVSLARLTVASIANGIGFSIDDVEDLKVAVSEACTNALRHGCGGCQTYNVRYTVEDAALTIEVIDCGAGYEPETVKEPVFDGEQAGGFGLFIIKSLMDEVEIISEKETGTSIKMVMHLRG